jgi:hypothetical protein
MAFERVINEIADHFHDSKIYLITIEKTVVEFLPIECGKNENSVNKCTVFFAYLPAMLSEYYGIVINYIGVTLPDPDVLEFTVGLPL